MPNQLPQVIVPQRIQYGGAAPQSPGVEQKIGGMSQRLAGQIQGALSGNPMVALQNGFTALGQIQGFAESGKDPEAWDVVRMISQTAQAVPFPPVQVIAAVIGFANDIIYELAGDKPCKFLEKGPCSGSYQGPSPEGLRYGWGDCCNPQPSGLGVMLAEHEPGYKKYPGFFSEVPAWDYPRIDCAQTEEARTREPQVWQQYIEPLLVRDWTKHPDASNAYALPCAADWWIRDYTFNKISSIFVPEAWLVQLWGDYLYKGGQTVLQPGFVDLHPLGFQDRLLSMKVRGPWSLPDHFTAMALAKRQQGWLTQLMSTTPTPDQLILLVVADPGRKTLMQLDQVPQDYRPVWRPGWMFRLAQAGVLNSVAIQTLFTQLGITQEALAQEWATTQKAIRSTLTLMLQASQYPPEQMADLLDGALNVVQKEIRDVLWASNIASAAQLQQALAKMPATVGTPYRARIRPVA